MRNCAGNFIVPIFFFLIMSSTASGCSPSATPAPIAFTPIATSSPTQISTTRPFWERTSTPDPFRATEITAIETVISAEESATAIPGKELYEYLPRLADLSQCQSLDYTVQLTSAQAVCRIIPQGSISMRISAAARPYAESVLSLPAGYTAVETPPIGQASVVGQSAGGDVITISFIKGSIFVQVSYDTPKRAINPDNVISIARRIERGVPDSSSPPLALSFPQAPQLEKRESYFSEIHFSLITNGRYRFSSDFQQGDRICVYVAPKQTAYQKLWTIVLYDLQTEKVAKKMLRGMYAQNICSGLEPDYSADSYRAGDRYEVRIAANDEWVATFPIVTQ